MERLPISLKIGSCPEMLSVTMNNDFSVFFSGRIDEMESKFKLFSDILSSRVVDSTCCILELSFWVIVFQFIGLIVKREKFKRNGEEK